MKKTAFTYQDPFAILSGLMRGRPSGGIGRSSRPCTVVGADRLRGVLANTLAAVRGLPWVHVTELERKSMGAAIFRGGAAFVDQVVDGILGRPALYPEVQEAAQRLSARQAEADLWLQLRGAFGRLHALANDAYLLAQSEAIKEGLRLVETMDGERDPARRSGLAAARLVFLGRRGKKTPRARMEAQGQGGRARKGATAEEIYRMLHRTLLQHAARLKGQPQ